MHDPLAGGQAREPLPCRCRVTERGISNEESDSGIIRDLDCLASLSHPGDERELSARVASLRIAYGEGAAWNIYLESILPHYYRFRHLLPCGVFICPQSMPKEDIRVLVVDASPEASSGRFWREYQEHFQGRRHVSCRFLADHMPAGEERWQDLTRKLGKMDVLVILPPISKQVLRLVSEAAADGCAVACVLPDDPAPPAEAGGPLPSLSRPDSEPDSAVEVFRAADVVIGFSEQAEAAAAEINKRFVQVEQPTALSLPPACAGQTGKHRPLQAGPPESLDLGPAFSWSLETALLAARLHHRTRHKRQGNGRPLVAFFLPCISGTGGGEIQLWRRMEIVRRLGADQLVVISRHGALSEDIQRVGKFLTDKGVEYEFLDSFAFLVTPYGPNMMPTPFEVEDMREFFARHAHRLALVHSLGFVPALGMVCSEFGVPHFVSAYGVDDAYQFPGGRLPFKYGHVVQSDSIRYAKKWSELLGCEWICAREMAPESLFALGLRRLYADPQPPRRSLVFGIVGSLMERKAQLDAIQAPDFLDKSLLERLELHLYGHVDTYPDYGRACRKAQERALRLGAKIVFHGHVTDVNQIYAQTDVLLSVSTFESFPSVIKEAAAAGCLVVASKAGGISEMMVDGVNCLLADSSTPQGIAAAITRTLHGTEQEMLTLRRNAFALALDEFHPRRALHDLALCYTATLTCAGEASAIQATPSAGTGHDEFTTASFEQTPSSYVSVGRSLRYLIKPEHPNWSRLDVQVGTHGRSVKGTLMVEILSENGEIQRHATCNLAEVRDKIWTKLRFMPIPNSHEHQFRVEIRIAGLDKGNRLSLYEANPPEKRLWRLLRRAGFKLRGNSPHCRLWYNRTLP